MKNACRIFVGKSEGKKQLVRLRCRWKIDVEMDFKVKNMEWFHVLQNMNQWPALVYLVMIIRT